MKRYACVRCGTKRMKFAGTICPACSGVPYSAPAHFAACRECGNVRRLRPRLLCPRCYENPAVRAKYPPLSTDNCGRNAAGPVPAAATSFEPGTPEKVAVLEARVAAGEQLWHPKDARLPARRLVSENGARNSFNRLVEERLTDAQLIHRLIHWTQWGEGDWHGEERRPTRLQENAA